ncbi:MAG: ARMT1-like domain-containing protein [Thermoplasmata archaeon]|nr:ARMT1-like domain-containing protein [Thermoplasmata archaeon]
MRPECVPCLIGRVLFEAKEADESKSTETIKAASQILGSLFGPGACSATVATRVHEEIYRILDTDDPYKDLKRRSNEISLELYREAERFVEDADDPLQAAFLCSIVGNILDFGIGTEFDSPELLKSEFRNLLDQGLGHDDTSEVRAILEHSEEVVYLADNCGEIVFDRLALKEIDRFDARIVLVVKEKPILTDATMTDLAGLGMEKIVDEIVEAPGFAVGISVEALNGAFGKQLRKADLVVAKGMANYEALSETDIGPVAYMLRTKCSPVADSLGLSKGINAVRLLKKGGVHRG